MLLSMGAVNKTHCPWLNISMPNDPTKSFWLMAAKYPVAVACIGLSSFMGYGISFILFDYRMKEVKKSHYGFHLAIGIGYTAAIFFMVNFDVVSKTITAQQLSSPAAPMG